MEVRCPPGTEVEVEVESTSRWDAGDAGSDQGVVQLASDHPVALGAGPDGGRDVWTVVVGRDSSVLDRGSNG